MKHSVVFTMGSYGTYFHAIVSDAELVALSSVLARAIPLRNKYNGTFEMRPSDADNTLSVTVINSKAIVAPTEGE